MSDLSIEQSIDELRDLVRCRCHPAFTERKLHDPDCNCDSAEAVEVLANALLAVQPDTREAALRESAKVLADRADYLEDAVKWGGSKQYLAGLKGGAIELRHARNSILALIDKPAHD